MFSAAVLCSVLWGCSSRTEQGTPVSKDDAVKVERLDLLITEYPNMKPERQQQMLDSLRRYWQGWLGIMGMQPVETESLVKLAGSPVVTAFEPEVCKAFPDFAPYADTIGSAMAAARRDSLRLPDYGYATVVWGNDKSIIVADTVMYIALNQYLGPEHEAYASFPAFLTQNKRPDMIAYNVLESALALTYPYEEPKAGATVLSRMAYEGALSYLKMRLVPEPREARALGFTEAQLADIRANEGFMWQQLVGRNLLYSTDSELIDRLMNPAQNSAPISPDAPGRAAVYIGYRIVCAYMSAHPATSLRTLLPPAFYASPSLLRRAAYQPAATIH